MNPEFERNLYLEFSIARLIGMPLFLTFIFALSYLMDDKQFGHATANIALGLYVLIVLFWGAKQSSESIFDELRNHTWDIQKTSAISPWSLSWGKLFGSTLFNWYGGLLCLLVYAFSAQNSESIPVLIMLSYAIGCGLLAQSLSLLVSVFALRKKQLSNASFNYLFVLFMLFIISSAMIGITDDHYKAIIIHWYSFEVNEQNFGLLSLALACGWCIVGIYRLLTQELQIRSLPWVWLLFIGFLVVYSHGLIVGANQNSLDNSGAELMLTAFAICATASYGLILMDDNSPMLVRRLWIYISEENWQRFLEELPCWFISLVLVLPACLYLTVFSPNETMEKLHLYPISAFLLMLRDCGIVLFFNYAPNPKRALGLSVLYLTFLYWIMPAIFIEAGANWVAALFLPLFADNLGLSLIFAGAQVGFIGYLLFNRWQKTVNQAF